jgi:uncharacterized damage-inducible protein DinB
MSSVISGSQRLFRYYKQLTEKAVAQLTEEQVRQITTLSSHSAAILMKHISGCLASRWTSFRTEDGEKTWRDRESEFSDDFAGREELMEHWQKGWKVLFDALDSLSADELEEIIYIRNEGHTITEAIQRNLSHTAYHTGQVVMIARHLAGDSWQSLSIPPGETESFNQKKFAGEKKRGFYLDRLG